MSESKQVDALAAILGIMRNNNATLNTILDTLVDMHTEGKSEEDKKAYLSKVDDRLAAYDKGTFDLMDNFKRKE